MQQKMLQCNVVLSSPPLYHLCTTSVPPPLHQLHCELPGGGWRDPDCIRPMQLALALLQHFSSSPSDANDRHITFIDIGA